MNSPLRSEIVVIGGGPAGLAAACTAAEGGSQVMLVDDTPWLGGQIWRGEQANPSIPEAQNWLDRFRKCGAKLLESTSVIAAPEPGALLAERDAAPFEIHWKRLILATGARELFLPFPGWTLPGVMGPGGMYALVKHGWPVEGRRVVVAGSGPLLLAVADGLRRHGARVVSVLEQAPRGRVIRFGLGLWRHPAKLWQAVRIRARLKGVPYRCGAWAIRAEGKEQLERAWFTDGRRTWKEDCDFLACGFGLVPNVELPLLLGCEVADGFVRVDEWQATSVGDVYCAGELTGITGADCALVEGQIAGYAATDHRDKAAPLRSERASWHRFRAALAQAFALRSELKSLATDDTLVCRCEDVTFGNMAKYGNWREAKLQSRCGMGACQGRVCGAAAKVLLGWQPESVRPPVLPAKVRSLVSEDSGQKTEDSKGISNSKF
jgi:NADPH-dependent 2,4-dienoyl-CoA reductase/sulfur reductase-like enzyme